MPPTAGRIRFDNSLIVRQLLDDEESGWLSLRAIVAFFKPKLIALHIFYPDIDDCLSEAFLQCATEIRAGHLEEPRALVSFVESVVRFTGINLIKRRISRNRREIATDLDEAALDQALLENRRRPAPFARLALAAVDNPEREYLDKEVNALQSRAVNHGLRRIPPQYSKVMRRALTGKPGAQIRKELQLTEDQYRLLRNRAKTQLIPIARRRLQALESGLSRAA